MKELRYVVLWLLFVVLVCSVSIIAANTSYGSLQLKDFNKLNGTEYTMRQWRIYRYEIEKLYPFVGQK